MLARHELSALCPRKHYNSISSSSSHVAIVKTAEGEYKSQASTFFLLHPTYSPVRLDWALYMLLSRALLPSFPPSLHPSAPDTFTFALLASANVMQVGTECVCVCASVIVWSIFCRCTPFFLFFFYFFLLPILLYTAHLSCPRCFLRSVTTTTTLQQPAVYINCYLSIPGVKVPLLHGRQRKDRKKECSFCIDLLQPPKKEGREKE